LIDGWGFGPLLTISEPDTLIYQSHHFLREFQGNMKRVSGLLLVKNEHCLLTVPAAKSVDFHANSGFDARQRLVELRNHSAVAR